MALPSAMLLGYRATMHRTRTNWIVFGVGGIAAAIQTFHIMTASTSWNPDSGHFDGFEVVARFFGHFVLSSTTVSAALPFSLGAAILAGLLAYGVRHRKWKDTYFVLLCGALTASILAAVSRVPVELLHPVLAGPRYFFFPYIFLLWMLLYVYGEVGKYSRVLIVLALACAFSQFVLNGRFLYTNFSWRNELKQCIASGADIYQFPVQFTGQKEIAWHVPLTGTQCKELVDRSLFR